MTLKRIVVVIAIISSFYAGYYTGKDSQDIPPGQVTTSGDVDIIRHKNIKQNRGTIKFDTISSGSGEINTVIKLQEYNQIVKVNVGLNYYGVEYMYKYKRFLLGGGVDSNRSLFISAGVMF